MSRFIERQKQLLFDESGMEAIEYVVVMVIALSIVAVVKRVGDSVAAKAESKANEVTAGLGNI